MNDEYKLYRSLCSNGFFTPQKEQLFLLKSLKNKGLELTQSGISYFLSDKIICLEEKQIRSGLIHDVNSSIDKLDVIYETGSTNISITHYNVNKKYSLLVSEFQSNGQGRRQNKWCSPLGLNLYFSIQFKLDDVTHSSFIPLIAACSICNALSKLGISGCMVKWPNDIYINGEKVAGILTESRYNHSNGLVIVIGIGINVNMSSEQDIDQNWTSLKKSSNKNFNRNVVLFSILNYLISDLKTICKFNFSHFIQDWDRLDFLKGKFVTVEGDYTKYNAMTIGLADDGALIVEANNHIHKVYSANISIRPDF